MDDKSLIVDIIPWEMHQGSLSAELSSRGIGKYTFMLKNIFVAHSHTASSKTKDLTERKKV